MADINAAGGMAVRLELNIIEINRVIFGGKTAINNNTLTINREELRNLLKRDIRLADVDIQLAEPGEKCRITGVLDAVEPRARTGDSGPDFPGILNVQGVVGHGTTCVLRGSVVLTSARFSAAEGRTGRAAAGLVDMWGPGAQAGPYGKTCNIIILPIAAAGLTTGDSEIAYKTAGLRTAVYLAKAGVDVKPDKVEIYDSEPMIYEGNNQKLPRVAYVFQVFSNQQLPLPGDPVFYGDNVDGIVPTIVHPNEILDGALTTRTIDTYLLQNHPVINELYNRHGKDILFVGIIITTAPNNGPTIDRVSHIAANQAKWILKADGIILTKYGGGAPEMTMAATAQKCERLGIRTALAIQHAGLDTAEISQKASSIFTDVPEVDAIVSLGTNVGGPDLKLPIPEKIIGADDAQMAGEIIRQFGQIKGSTSLIGNSRLMTVRY